MADPNVPAAPVTITSLAALRAAYPDLCNSLAGEARAEGASAERSRITGIENLGSQMKGHEKLIADMKADGSVTTEQAAVRLIGAENALRAGQLAGIKAVEDITGKVPAAPRTPGADEPPKHNATTPEGWKAEFEGSATLQAEFGTAERYEIFKRNEGKVRFLRKA